MGAHAVGLQVLVGEAVMGALGGLLARAGHARDGIGHHRRRRVHEPRADSGRRSERGGRRVAAGAAHEHGLAGSAALGRGGQLDVYKRQFLNSGGRVEEGLGDAQVAHLVGQDILQVALDEVGVLPAARAQKDARSHAVGKVRLCLLYTS